MAHNSFGNAFSITTFGESHGEALGVIIDGVAYSVPQLRAMIRERHDLASELATVWVDLNAFLRAWGRLLPAEREYGLLKLQAVAGQLQAHLEQASSLLAELEKTRRNR